MDEPASQSPPAWATWITTALAAHRTAPAPAPRTSAGVLIPALAPLLAAAQVELEDATAEPALQEFMDIAALRTQTLDHLAQRLARSAARTLVLELHSARKRGLLVGPTPQRRFASFLEQMANGGLGPLFRRYPVLARILAQECRHAVEAQQELLARFATDRQALIGSLLGGDPGPLVSAEPRGDRHCGGRAVSVLRFADGQQLVYRPRPVALYPHFADLVVWLNCQVPGLDLRTARALVRERYGWVEFVPAASCADVASVHRFYYRYGALIALLYVLRGTDVHYENLVAAADQPVVVDVETLIQPHDVPTPPAHHDPAVAAWARSVLSTASLPVLLRGDHAAVDLSGFGGAARLPLPYLGVAWADTGTDTMRLVRLPAATGEAANRPTLPDRFVQPTDHIDDLVRGFRAAYDAIAGNRAEALGLLHRFRDDHIRLIPRATMLYARLLDESTHPDVLRAAADRDRLFELLADTARPDGTLSALMPAELADLWAGDVPYFACRAGSREILTSRGDRAPAVLAAPPLALAEDTVRGLDDADRRGQEWTIRAAIASATAAVDHRTPAPSVGPLGGATAFAPDRALAAAERIARELAATAHRSNGRANWLGVEPVDDRDWTVYPMGAGLPHGYCGVALFLAQLGALTRDPRHHELAAAALAGIPQLVDVLASEPDAAQTVGYGFDGIGGICYALVRAAQLLDDAEPLRWLDALLDIADAGGAGSSPAFGDGLAGGLAAMVGVATGTGSATAIGLAARYADRLTAMVRAGELGTPARTGFVHGPAGVAWALANYARSGLDDTAAGQLAAARAAFATEPVAADRGWCTGRSGRLLAAAELGLTRTATGLLDAAPSRDLSLCHGELGVLDAMLTAGTAPENLHGVAGLVLALLDDGERAGGTPSAVPTPGLLLGLSGIGYGLLRLGFPDRVPSVLCMAINDQINDRPASMNGA